MNPPAYLVARDLPGQLWIMPHPPATGLADAIASYAARGIDTLVSMLPPDEATDLGLGDEGRCCASQGIVFSNHPIVDFGLPERGSFDPLVARIAGLIREGHHVAVHCRAGIGRSGMAAACTLIALGQSAEQAVDRISTARGVSIPDTAEQRAFIQSYAE